MPEETFMQYKARRGCTCPITLDMTFYQLRDLGSGCTRVGVCPVLTKRRSQVRQPNDAERAEEDRKLAKALGIRKVVGT